jgi:predicted RNA-binding Zn-ribbon protein involved in translation (DUF1610 family)
MSGTGTVPVSGCEQWHPVIDREIQRQRLAKSGFTVTGSKRRLRLHRKMSADVACPQCGTALVVRCAMYRERSNIEQRTDRAEAERGNRARSVPAQQVDQQRGDQRAVDDQAGIALRLGDVAAMLKVSAE